MLSITSLIFIPMIVWFKLFFSNTVFSIGLCKYPIVLVLYYLLMTISVRSLILAISNGMATNILKHGFGDHMLAFLLGIHLGVEFLGQNTCVFSYSIYLKVFQSWLSNIYSYQDCMGITSYFTSLTTVCFFLFHFNHSGGTIVVSQCF